jgi:hypothetical protein
VRIFRWEVKIAGLLIFGLLMLAFMPAAFAQQADPPKTDQWNFSDEEEIAPTWTDDLRDQSLDLALFAGFATLALVGFFKKSERLKWITMAAAVVYLGFARSQLISVVNIFALTHWNLPVFRHNLAWYFFAIFTLVTTILWGRLYCGRICAFGSMTQLMDKSFPRSFDSRSPPHRPAAPPISNTFARRRSFCIFW